MNRQLFFGSLVFVLGLLIRVIGVGEPAPQPDEIHWQSRSYKIIKVLRLGDLNQATAHIGHPGVSPALIMALGEWLAEKFNNSQGAVFGDGQYIDRLSASRIANAVASSFLVAVVYLGVLVFLGPIAAFFAGLFVALDPHHLALSRMAHLDSLLALFSVSSVFCYAWALRTKSIIWKLVAGLCWGLAILAKPTAASVVLVFLVFKLCRNRIVPQEAQEPVVVWSDVWTLITSHVVFTVLFTRVWQHGGHWRRLQIESQVADLCYELALLLQANAAPVVTLLGAVAAISIYLFRKDLQLKRSSGKRWRYHVAQALLVSSLMGLVLFLFPTVIENIVRFWFWVMGLAGVSHQAYGVVWPELEGGYFGLILARLPTIVLVGVVIGLFGFLLAFQRTKTNRYERSDYETVCFQLLWFVFAIVWIVPLEFSNKQTIRYVLPVLAALNIVAGGGYDMLLRYLRGVFEKSDRRSRLSVALVLIISLSYIASVLRWHPNYELFFNLPSGGLSAAVAKGHHFPFVGQNDAVRFLYRCAESDPDCKRVFVRGDIQALEYASRRLFPNDSKRITFISAKTPAGGYYNLTYSFFEKTFFKNYNPIESRVFSYDRFGESLLSIFKLPISSFVTPEYFDILEMDRHTGRVVFYQEGQGLVEHDDDGDTKKVLIAVPGQDKTGHLYFGGFVRLAPGTYRIRVLAGRPKGVVVDPALGDERYVFRIELGESCQRVVTLGELSDSELRQIDFQCTFQEMRGVQLKGYWWARVPVLVSGLEIVSQANYEKLQ